MTGASFTFSGLANFAAEFPQIMELKATELLQEIHRGLHERAFELAVELTPSGGAAGRTKPSMRGSWKNFPPNPESAIVALRPTKVGNVAPHAMVIDLGRRPSRPYRRKTKKGGKALVRERMLGSVKAPLGIRPLVMTRLAAEEAAIVGRAIQRVMGADS